MLKWVMKINGHFVMFVSGKIICILFLTHFLLFHDKVVKMKGVNLTKGGREHN